MSLELSFRLAVLTATSAMPSPVTGSVMTALLPASPVLRSTFRIESWKSDRSLKPMQSYAYVIVTDHLRGPAAEFLLCRRPFHPALMGRGQSVPIRRLSPPSSRPNARGSAPG